MPRIRMKIILILFVAFVIGSQSYLIAKNQEQEKTINNLSHNLAETQAEQTKLIKRVGNDQLSTNDTVDRLCNYFRNC